VFGIVDNLVFQVEWSVVPAGLQVRESFFILFLEHYLLKDVFLDH
jgi:hypothetical protein